MAQTTNIAYASEPRSAYVVFFDSSTGQLSNAAADTVRSVARAAGSAKTVRVAGRADHEAVKSELVRDDVPASSIIDFRQPASSLPKVGDGLKIASGQPSISRITFRQNEQIFLLLRK